MPKWHVLRQKWQYNMLSVYLLSDKTYIVLSKSRCKIWKIRDVQKIEFKKAYDLKLFTISFVNPVMTIVKTLAKLYLGLQLCASKITYP